MESLSPISQGLIETVGVILLTTCGAVIGWFVSRLRGRLWVLGFAVPLILLIIISIPKWIPEAERLMPFRWIMAGRTVYALSGPICATLLVTPLSRLPHRNERIWVGIFALVFCSYFSVLPFILPVMTIGELSKIQTVIDREGVCRQSTDYNCGPAAAVTALRIKGIRAEEGPLAIAARTSYLAGTTPDLLRKAIEKLYGVSGELVYPRSINELKSKEPWIAGVDFSFLVDHYVTVLSVTDSRIIIADPLDGKTSMTHDQFARKWRKFAIVLHWKGN